MKNNPMKLFTLCLLLLGFSCLGHTQQEIPKAMPPLKMLPKKGEAPKKIFELPSSTNYSVYDSTGKFISKGNGQFIDCSKLKKGAYFIQFNGTSKKFVIE